MHRPSAEEFLQALLETLDDLPPDFIQRLEERAEEGHDGPSASDPGAVRGCRR